MKFTKKLKALAVALPMMLLSTVAAVTGTVAWFTANNIVSATNMTVQAQSEKGIVIAAYNGSTAPVADDFDETADDGDISVANMLPTWTADCLTWYHASSTKSNDGQSISSAGYTKANNGATSSDPQYYLIKKFQIKATGATQDVYVKAIDLARGENETAQAYDNVLRVAVKTSYATLFFAPVGTHNAPETIDGDKVKPTALDSDPSVSFTGLNTLDAKTLNQVSTTPVDVEIYIYYDGEDADCKSDNIPTDAFNHLTVSVNFTSEAPNA